MSTLQALNLVLASVNLVMAIDSFTRGHSRSGWIGSAIAVLCFTLAVI